MWLKKIYIYIYIYIFIYKEEFTPSWLSHVRCHVRNLTLDGVTRVIVNEKALLSFDFLLGLYGLIISRFWIICVGLRDKQKLGPLFFFFDKILDPLFAFISFSSIGLIVSPIIWFRLPSTEVLKGRVSRNFRDCSCRFANDSSPPNRYKFDWFITISDFLTLSTHYSHDPSFNDSYSSCSRWFSTL